jgi:glycosyltransferase involved in cell wall biosynthesis
MTTIVIPARNEIFLKKTVLDILAKATGEIQVFVVLDGYWPSAEKIVNDPRVNYLHFSQPRGMRTAINSAVRISKGDYIMKLDAHCMLDQGFDEVLSSECDEDWIVVPRRKRLDAENWAVQEVGKPDVDYEFIGYPGDSEVSEGIKGQIWTQRILDRKDILIDENMTFQGSCYFMSRKHWDRLGGMQIEGYGEFVREAQELSLKTWLGGGKVMTNKKTWYAHLHKGKKYGRMYFLNKAQADAGNAYCDDYWFNNRWDKRKYNLSWLIERFSPVPTWPEDRSLWTR